MRVIATTDPHESGVGSAVTIGMFDGLHRGHVWLLRKLRQVAAPEGLRTVVVTFDPHPMQLLRPVSAPKLLTDTAQRLQLLESTGLIDACLVVPFEEARSRQSPVEFVDEVLVRVLAARVVIVGADFRFGADRAGDVAVLARLGADRGFTVHAAPLLPVAPSRPGVACCSTHIRSLVAQGELERATLLLGRPLEVVGRVVATSWPAPGRGAPTVVVRVAADRALPTEGTYGGAIIAIDGRERAAGISVRVNHPAQPYALLDVHVVDRVKELMDQTVAVRLYRRIWATGSADLFTKAGQHEAEVAAASATGGWAASV